MEDPFFLWPGYEQWFSAVRTEGIKDIDWISFIAEYAFQLLHGRSFPDIVTWIHIEVKS
jgi:hypothetical protein